MSAEQNISGVSVTAGKYDWEESFGPSTYPVHERRVSFLTDSYGYRFEMSSGDPDLTEELVSRLVRRVIDGGVAADRLSSEGAVLAHPWEADPNYSVGEPNWNDGADEYDSDCPYCVDGMVHTHPHLPSGEIAKGPDDPAAGNLPDGDPIAYEP